eukprot:766675-Hanusia_phi.AAC.1
MVPPVSPGIKVDPLLFINPDASLRQTGPRAFALLDPINFPDFDPPSTTTPLCWGTPLLINYPTLFIDVVSDPPYSNQHTDPTTRRYHPLPSFFIIPLHPLHYNLATRYPVQS